MRVTKDYRTCNYEVTISEKELKTAFESSENLQRFMHTIVAKTHGKYIADVTFPLEKEKGPKK